MAENGFGGNTVTRMNGAAKVRVELNSPKHIMRSMSVERKRTLSPKQNGEAHSGLESPQNVSGSPLQLELNRLENQLKVKEKDLERATAECKAIKQLNVGKDKAISHLEGDLEKLKGKYTATEKLLADKILDLKKAEEQKKAAFAAQAAAEATSRRLQAAQKNAPSLSLDAALAPMEAHLKLSQKEVAKLTEDCKVHERLIRAKEAALLKAEQAVTAAEERAAHVDVLINQRKSLEKRLESEQEENKTVDKLYKQKIEELKRVTEQVAQLQESLTAAGGVASTVREYQRQIQDLQAELRTSQEELSRAKVAVNRVAVAVANDWKDDLDKVIPMQQYLEERKVFQGEVQSLREKLAQAEKTTRFEAQMKEKYLGRLRVIEEGQKFMGSHKEVGRRFSTGAVLQRANSSQSSITTSAGDPDSQPGSATSSNGGGSDVGLVSDEELVSATLYNILEREVVALRKASQEKDQTLKDKEDAIEMLSRKVELLTKAMEAEAKKSRRELSSIEKELAALKLEAGGDGKRRTNATIKAPSLSPSTSLRKSVTKAG